MILYGLTLGSRGDTDAAAEEADDQGRAGGHDLRDLVPPGGAGHPRAGHQDGLVQEPSGRPANTQLGGPAAGPRGSADAGSGTCDRFLCTSSFPCRNLCGTESYSGCGPGGDHHAQPDLRGRHELHRTPRGAAGVRRLETPAGLHGRDLDLRPARRGPGSERSRSHPHTVTGADNDVCTGDDGGRDHGHHRATEHRSDTCTTCTTGPIRHILTNRLKSHNYSVCYRKRGRTE
jgi:hypothetical protein